MPCAGAARGANPNPPPIVYELNLRNTVSHLVQVQMFVSNAAGSEEIQFPAWNALYQMRDFVRHVQDLRAMCNGRPVELIPVDLNTWRNPAPPCDSLEVDYAVYANEESPFSCVLNEQHALLNFAQLLFYLPEERERPSRIKLILPEGWKVVTLLDDCGPPGEFKAPDYDTLADSPAEAGPEPGGEGGMGLKEYSYQQSGATYRVAIFGDPAEYSSRRLVESIEKITATETAMMQDVPFSRYTFIFHFLPSAGGGMEHRNGAVIGFPAADLRTGWEDLESAIAHEFFHLWNVKRIRPQGLEPVDYVRGNDTRDLWFSEGVTSTYQELVLLRSGLVKRERFYERLANEISRLQERPARRFQSLKLAGIDAWLEAYADYLRPERSVSYYNKGELVGFLLDLAIRHASSGGHSLDDLMRRLDQDFARRGRFFTDDDVATLVRAMAGPDLDVGGFFRDYVTGTKELDYDTYLGYAGLRLEKGALEVPAWGFEAVRSLGGEIQVESVERDSRAAKAGLERGDLITKVNGQPLLVLPQDLSGVKPGEKVELEVRRSSERMRLKVRLGRSQETKYRLREDPQATEGQLRVREGWLEGKTVN